MSTTITITVTVDGNNVSVSTATGGEKKAYKGGGNARRSNADEVIPPGGSSDPLPGKKGLTIGEAPMNDLTWWRGKIAAGLDADPDSRFYDSNKAQLDAITREIKRRENGGADVVDTSDYGAATAGDDLPF
jgi:hypothetical protein